MPPSGIRKFFELAEEVDDVISLGVGEPDFSAPWAARTAAIDSLERGKTSYTSNRGMRELRERIADATPATRSRSTTPKRRSSSRRVRARARISLNGHAKPRRADRYRPAVLVSHVPGATFAGIDVITFRRARKMSSNHPRGAGSRPLRRRPTYSELLPEDSDRSDDDGRGDGGRAASCRDHDLVVLSDEIYSDLRYEDDHASIATHPGMRERTIVFNGFSKAYAMTGLRLGYAMGPPEPVDAMNRIHRTRCYRPRRRRSTPLSRRSTTAATRSRTWPLSTTAGGSRPHALRRDRADASRRPERSRRPGMSRDDAGEFAETPQERRVAVGRGAAFEVAGSRRSPSVMRDDVSTNARKTRQEITSLSERIGKISGLVPPKDSCTYNRAFLLSSTFGGDNFFPA